MNGQEILNLILIITILSLLFLVYRFRRKIISISKNVFREKDSLTLSNKNRFCIFLHWIKFLNFWIWFVFMLSGIVIIFWMLFKNPILPDFFNKYTIEVGLKTINDPSVIQNYFAGNFSALIALIGVFASYCYFFDYIKSIGWKIYRKSNKNAKFSSFFIYLFFICVFISIVFIGGALENYFGKLDSNKILELLCLSAVLIVAVLNVQFFRNIYLKDSLTYSDFKSLGLFVRREKFNVFFSSFTLLIFFITIEVALFGYIFGFNPLSIISLDVILLFTVWVLGIVNQHPTQLSTIQLKSGRSIYQVYILETDDIFVYYLTKADKIEKVTISSIFKVEKDSESSVCPSLSTDVEDYSNANNRICHYLSKINEPTIILASIVSIFIGIIFMLVGACLLFLQFQEGFILGVSVILFLMGFGFAFLLIILYFIYRDMT